jgi:hypothetical protein
VVAFGSGDGVALAVAGDRKGVDGIDLAAGGAQAGDQQAAAGLDRDRDRLVGGVAVFGEQLDQRTPSGGVITDPPAGQQIAVCVDQGDVVMLFAPIDSAGHLHHPHSFARGVDAACKPRGDTPRPNERAQRLDIRSAVRGPSPPQGPRSVRGLDGPETEAMLPAAGSHHDCAEPADAGWRPANAGPRCPSRGLRARYQQRRSPDAHRPPPCKRPRFRAACP